MSQFLGLLIRLLSLRLLGDSAITVVNEAWKKEKYNGEIDIERRLSRISNDTVTGCFSQYIQDLIHQLHTKPVVS